MADNSKIEWTDSTFNPWIGCTKVGPGCDHCYAEADFDVRRHRAKWGSGNPRSRTAQDNWKKPLQWDSKPFYECPACGWRGDGPIAHSTTTGEAICPVFDCIGTLKQTRRRVFCASLADVFDNEVSPSWRFDLFELIAKTPNLDWLLLTKRIGNASRMIADIFERNERYSQPGQSRPPMLPTWPWPNVWIGATVVNQEEADRDIPKLLAVPARVRWLSMEPLLGPVDISQHIWPTHWHWDAKYKTPEKAIEAGAYAEKKRQALVGAHCSFIDWVVVGGESGANARPMQPSWARSLRDQCAAAGVPFLFKQWGEWAPYDRSRINGATLATTNSLDSPMQRIGKHAAGRALDGVIHDGYPEIRNG